MRKILFLSFFLLFGLTYQLHAQERIVAGKVTSATDGGALPGVNVTVKGAAGGTITDVQGQYSISVPQSDAILVFSFVGTQSQEIEVGNKNVINVAMRDDIKQLNEVVVTALGIEKEKRGLGYAVQDVKGEDLIQARESNVLNSLSGRVAGVQIVNSSGAVGASSRVVIRGNNSLRSNNQPLFVVNGIPIDNSTNRNDGYGGVDFGNAASDINPNDIESISVLKGPAASALYGARAANGVILITTKSGKGAQGLGITFDHNSTFETPLRLPDYQNEYGQGYPDSKGVPQFSYVDGAGGGLMDGVDESWGPRFDGQPRSQFFGEGSWVASPNNVKDFFEVGRTMTNNLAISGGNERANARLSVTNMNQKGILPNTDLRRNVVNLSSNMKLNDRLSANANIIYTQNASDNRPGNGYGGENVMQQFIWFGRQVDISRLKNYENPDGTQYNWNYNYHNNPYWILYKNTNSSNRNRVNGNVSLKYNFTDWLSLQGRIGTDVYSEMRKRVYAKNTVDWPDGRFIENNINFQEINADFLLSATKSITSDITLSGSFGGNTMKSNYTDNQILVRALIAPNLYSTQNSDGAPAVTQFATRQEINSFYGTAGFNYKNFFFLDLTGRNDWASTLPDGQNSFFYPSISSSFVFSDAFNLENSILSFGKIRGGWAKAGNYADPHRLRNLMAAGDPFGSIPNYTVHNRLAPLDLKHETTTSTEVGTELKFFQDRLGLDVTYYRSMTYDQIIEVPVSATSGFRTRVVNAGSISNNGIEAVLNATPVQLSNGFKWDVAVNFARNRSEVVELDPSITSYRMATYWGLNLEARPGYPYGTFFGSGYLRDDQGNIVVNANGIPRRDPVQRVLGNILPDWTGGIRNSVSYRNASLSFLVDMRKGGDIFSVTHMFGRYAGVTEETVEGREDGILVPGSVVANADGSYSPNTVRATAIGYNQGLYGTHEAHIFDGSFVKLREVVLSYNLPKSLLGKTQLSGASISLVGRNLLLLHSNIPHVDPETAFGADDLSQGFEFGALPSTRSYGVSLRVTL
jgi:TonB-linked SusC/RagA family outer membrane protein